MGRYSNHKKEIQTQESNVSRTDTYKKPGIIHRVSKQDLQQLLISLYKSQTCLLIQYLQTPHSGTNLQGHPNTRPSMPRKIPTHPKCICFVYIKTSFPLPVPPQTPHPFKIGLQVYFNHLVIFLYFMKINYTATILIN